MWNEYEIQSMGLALCNARIPITTRLKLNSGIPTHLSLSFVLPICGTLVSRMKSETESVNACGFILRADEMLYLNWIGGWREL